jgi:hypothetical protein
VSPEPIGDSLATLLALGVQAGRMADQGFASWWHGLTWGQWVSIWEAQGFEGLDEWLSRLWDLHAEPVLDPEEREFARKGLEEIARIERRRQLQLLLREMLASARPDISGDVLIDALIELERLRLELEAEGSFEQDFEAALEIAEARAEAARRDRV